MKILIILLTTIQIASTQIPESNQQEIVGHWLAKDLENSTIQIYLADDDLLYGKIVESDEEKYIGKIVVKKLKYFSDEKVWKGIIKSLKRNMEINVTISKETEEELKLIGKKLLMKKTFYWTKV